MKIKNVIAAAVFAAAAVLAGCSNALAGNSENSGTADITVACRGADLTSDAVSCTVTTTLFNAADDSVLGTCVNTLLTGTGIVYPVFTKIDLQMKVYAVITAEVSVKTDMRTYSTVVAAGRSSAEQVKKITALNVEIKKFDPATTFFVAGENPSLITAAGSDSNDGAFKTPFATLGKALDAVNTANDGSSSYTIFVDGTVNSQKSGATADEPGLGCITPTKTLNLTIQSLRDKATLDASSLSGEPVLQINNGQFLSQLTLKGLTLAAGSSAAADGVSPVCIEDSSSGSLTIDSCTVKNGTVYASSADVTLNASTISVSSAKETAVHAQKVTLSDSSVDITGIVEAAGIWVNAVPQKAITVEPYVTTTGAAFGDFLVPGDNVTLDTADFPLSDTDDYYYYKNENNVYGVMPVQELTYSLSSATSALTAVITYAGIQQSLFDSSTVYLGNMYTTVDQNGQIYVLSCSDSTYSIYSAGTSYTVTLAGASSFCSLNDGTGSLLAVNSDKTGFYKLTLADTAYTSTAVTLSDSTVSSISAVTSVKAGDGTQYVYYAYTEASSSSVPAVPKLAAAVLSDDTLTTKWTVDISLADSSIYSSNVCVADMTIGMDGNLYLLLSDVSGGSTFKNLSETTAFYFNQRGALVNAGAVSSLESDSVPSVTFIPYGWRNSANGTMYNSSAGWSASPVTVYASIQSSYNGDENFAGPVRFLAVTPKKITMADYGYYVTPDISAASYYHRKRGTAVFTLDSSSLAINDSTDTYLYGENGSMDNSVQYRSQY